MENSAGVDQTVSTTVTTDGSIPHLRAHSVGREALTFTTL